MQVEGKYPYLDQYKIVRTLGAGYHAQVKLGEDLQGNLVAIKKYKKQTATLETLKHEINIMKQLDHENLVKLVAVRQNATYKNQDESTYVCFAIVLEYVGGGQLFDFVAQTGKFSQKVTRTYFHQMMNGLYYLHQKGFAHRDIKPQNILLSQLFILKIADFGFSAALKGKDGSGILRTKLGTEGYMAPQIPTKKYEGKSVDIFAAGVILFIMYAGNPPFEKATPTDPYYKILKEKKYDIFWKAHSRKRPVGFFSESFKNLFIRLVAFQPAQRPTIQQISKNQWVSEGICTHDQIKQQFSIRQSKLNSIMQSRRAQIQKQRQIKQTAVSNQASIHRGSCEIGNQFIDLYNSQFVMDRKLQIFQLTKDDILIGNIALSLAILKQYLSKIQMNLKNEEGEQQDLFQQQSEILKFQKLEDNKVDKINAIFSYTYQIEEERFQQKIEIEITIGKTLQGQNILRIQRVEGNILYFKKLFKEIKTILSK